MTVDVGAMEVGDWVVFGNGVTDEITGIDFNPHGGLYPYELEFKNNPPGTYTRVGEFYIGTAGHSRNIMKTGRGAWSNSTGSSAWCSHGDYIVSPVGHTIWCKHCSATGWLEQGEVKWKT